MDQLEGPRALPVPGRIRPVPLSAVAALAAVVTGTLVWLRAANDGWEPDGRNWWLVGWTVTGAASTAVAIALPGRPGRTMLRASLLVVGAMAYLAALATQYLAYASNGAGAGSAAGRSVRWPLLAEPSEWAWQVGGAVLVVLAPWELLPATTRRSPIGRILRWIGLVGVAGLTVLAIARGLDRDRSLAENVARWLVAFAATGHLVFLARRWWRGRRSSDDALAIWLLAGMVAAWLTVVPDLLDVVTWDYPGLHVVPPLLLLVTVPLLVIGSMIHAVRRGTGTARTSHRAIEWALYATAIVVLYTAVVAGLGRLVGGNGPTWLLVAATGSIAVLAEPVRERVRRLVDRLVYGSRDDPLAVVRRVVDHVGADTGDELLPALVVSLQRELRLDAVAIDIVTPSGWERVASVGPATTHRRDVLLRHGDERVGRLVLGWDAGPSIRVRDERVLEELAGPVGLAVGWVRLAADLRRSGAAVVSAREEERRRLRRDLHDGVGPTLTGVSLGLRSAVKQLGRLVDPDHGPSEPTRSLLVHLADEVDGVVAEIKRIVRDLRPTALDQLGLAGAVAEFAHGLDDELVISLELPTTPVTLPAVVEVAAYRIATEALTNVIRHAGATHCSLSIVTGEVVHIDVVDDGVGFNGDALDGVGITAMRERVGHLGGELRILSNAERGTHLHVTLPAAVS
jgi:signal transduction histidine kinase